MKLTALIKYVGLIFVGLGVFLVGIQSIHWWFIFTLGVFLCFGAVNDQQNQESLLHQVRKKNKALVKVYLGFLLAGAFVEAVRIIPDLWEYEGFYNRILGVFLLIVLGYPIFSAGIYETYVFFSHLFNSMWLGGISASIFLLLWNDILNGLSPMWVINQPFASFVTILFVVGYVFEVAVAVLWSRMCLE